MDYPTTNHAIVPLHEILSEDDASSVLMQYKVDRSKLPKIRCEDPALPQDAKIGDIIRISRESQTAGKSIYYRVVVD